jgi:NADH dehydrogenase FAD-containing subunit
MVKPIEGIATNIDKVLATAGPAVSRRVVIVGAGAGGTEISFALAARFRGQGRCAINLCDAAAAPAAERGPKTSRLVLAALRRHGIEFLGGSAVERADADGVHLAGGRVLAATLIIWAAGAAGPELFAASELPVDERGFLQVGNDLRCDRYPEIFAAGDCATLASYPSLPKAGVHAVRQGPVLADNLCAAATDAVSKPYRPQKRFLALLNTGDGRAILSYGGWAARGRWAWWLKDYIDRKFVAKYAPSSLGK